jgi:hypothetical protein
MVYPIAVKLRKIYLYKNLVFGLKALYILAQCQRPERTMPWVKMRNPIYALKGHHKNLTHIFSILYAALSGRRLNFYISSQGFALG